jgi:asparagine synthase (glutamine-hydrolysing)
MPLSTPNEVAIHEVARTLRADGNIVTLSGEGADELFAGYDVPILDAARFEGLLSRDAQRDGAWNSPEIMHPGEFQLFSNAWISPKAKGAVLNEDLWKALEGDHALLGFYRSEFEAVASERDDDSPLQAHLRFHRRINLAGLLQRLDTATMQASVEGRTPFADREVMEFAEGLTLEEKCVVFSDEGERLNGGGFRSLTVAVPMNGGKGVERAETKRVLRRAFAADLPPEVVTRKKASFPLPFQGWIEDHVQVLRRSSFAKSLFTPAAIEAVAAQPAAAWPFAWPMVNVGIWGEGWWG